MFIRNVFVCVFCNWELRVNNAEPYTRQIKNIRANEYALYNLEPDIKMLSIVIIA